MRAIILAASRSKRLEPFVATRPKPMISIAGKYILEYTIEYLKEAGVREIFIVVNHKQEMIKEHFSYGNDLGVGIEYIFQEDLKGIGHALKLGQEVLNAQEDLLLVYGDVLAMGNFFQPALKVFYETGDDVAVISHPFRSQEFGNVYLDHNMKVTRLVEKPQERQHGNYVFSGVFVLKSDIFERLSRHENDMEKCFQELISEDRLRASLWEEGWIDIIYPWHILLANGLIMKNWNNATIHSTVEMRGHVEIQGPVVIEEGVVIESGTILKGPSYIGKNCYLGNNCLIREYSVLGPDSIIGYGTELKNCVIFGKSNIGRLSFIGDSVLGEAVHIGSGITTVNHWPEFDEVLCRLKGGDVNTELPKLGTFIGDNSSIGARHSIAPGLIIPNETKIPDLITLQNPIKE